MHTIPIDRAIQLASTIRDDRRIRADHELAAYCDLLLDERLKPEQPCRPGR